MLRKHAPVEEVREMLHPLRQLWERHLYTGVELAPQVVLTFYDLFIAIDDALAQLGHGIEAQASGMAQLEAIARDLDLIDRPRGPIGAGGFLPRGAAMPPASAQVLPFRRPGGAA